MTGSQAIRDRNSLPDLPEISSSIKRIPVLLANLSSIIMAKIAVTLSVILSLFLLSHARTPSDLPLSSVTSTKNDENTLPSSERPDAVTFTISIDKLEPETASDTISFIGIPRPLMTSSDDSFRPINNIRKKRPFPFRASHRCRHNPRLSGRHVGLREIPYGDDMIDARQIPYGDDMIDARQIPYGHDMIDAHQIPAREEHQVMNHVDKEEKEGGGFMKWLDDIVNRF